MENRTPEDTARAFIAAMEAGALPDDLITSDMTAWTLTQGDLSLAVYQGALAWLRSITGGTMAFTIDHITATATRAVIETRSSATLSNGELYGNTYVFALGLRDGRICSVREHFNVAIVQAKLLPLLNKTGG